MDSDNDSGNSNDAPVHRRCTRGTRAPPSTLPRLSVGNQNKNKTSNDHSYHPNEEDRPYSDDDEDDDDDEDQHQSSYRGRGRPSQQQSLMDSSYDDGNDHHNLPRYTGPLREQDRFLPIANIAKIMKKKVFQTKVKIAKDAKETIQ
ncbi:unnamed protein product, partial [Adineta ricciae]